MTNHEATEQAYKKGYEDGKPKWIPVTERLPHKNMRVLACYTFDGYMQFVQVLDYYATDKKPHFQHEGDGMRVTHWMPLPKPPKGG